MTTRKSWSREEQLRIVQGGMAPNANVEGVCRAHGIGSSQFYKWKDQALAGMRAGLESQQGSPLQCQRIEMARLKRGARAYGYPTDLWTLKRVAEVIRKEYGV